MSVDTVCTAVCPSGQQREEITQLKSVLSSGGNSRHVIGWECSTQSLIGLFMQVHALIVSHSVPKCGQNECNVDFLKRQTTYVTSCFSEKGTRLFCVADRSI